MIERLKRYWTIIRRPSVHFSLGFLTLGGFIGGIVFWGAFNTAMEFTNTETFCTGCHEMRDNVFAELKSTIHYTNRSGVRAMCSDCHVPHDWTDKMARKMQASKEVWGKIFGTIDTPEKFQRQAARARPARVGALQGQRFARVPQLPQLRVHGLHAPERARAEHALDLPGEQGEDLHRLPQGHRPQAAAHPAGRRAPARRRGRSCRRRMSLRRRSRATAARPARARADALAAPGRAA